jgi:hypothetical protein
MNITGIHAVAIVYIIITSANPYDDGVFGDLYFVPRHFGDHDLAFKDGVVQFW